MRRCSHRGQYLPEINRVYKTNFVNHQEYVDQRNFGHILKQIALNDVVNAIRRAREIQNRNAENKKPVKHKVFTFYKENPAMSVNLLVEEILRNAHIDLEL